MSHDPTPLDSVLIGMKAFVPWNLHSLNQNIMCKTDKDKHITVLWNLHMDAGWSGNSCIKDYLCTCNTGHFENSGPCLGCTVMLLTHRRDCYKERGVKISSSCFFPNSIITGYLSIYRTHIYFTEKEETVKVSAIILKEDEFFNWKKLARWL